MLRSLVRLKWHSFLVVMLMVVAMTHPVYAADRDEFRRSIFEDGTDNEVLIQLGNTGTGHVLEVFDGTVSGGTLIFRIRQSGTTAQIEAIHGLFLNYTDDGGIGSGNAVIGLPERASDPSTPITNLGLLFCKDNGGIETPYWINSAGTVYDMLLGGSIPDAANPTVNAAGEIATENDGEGSISGQALFTFYSGGVQYWGISVDSLVGLSDGDVAAYDSGTNKFVMEAQSGGGGTPGGSDTEVQYNDAGSFGGDSDWTYDDTLNHMLLQNGLLAVEETLRIYRVGSLDYRWDIQAPSGLAANYAFILPLDDGNNNEVLKTDGNGVLSWANITDASTAIHDNIAGEIAAIAVKGSPVSTDLILIEDSTDSYNKKGIQIGNLPTLPTTKYIPFEMRLGIPVTDLSVVDFRQGMDTTNLHVYAKRIALSGSNTSSLLWLAVQLPADFDSFYDGTNIYVNVLSSDRVNNTITLFVFDDTGDVDDGVDGADIEPGNDATWWEASDQLTETDANYAASDWIYIRVNVNLDDADYYYIGEGYILYTTN